LKYQAGRLVLR